MSFDAETRKLMINEKTIDLTRTETRVLRIFSLSPNEAIERSRLQKEIWEDEGVIVGRSPDMFISKLRKNWNLIRTSRLLSYAAKDIGLKSALKKTFPLRTEVIRIHWVFVKL